MKTYKLDDTTIMQIVRLLQMGLLTGTDVADQLRTLELTTTDTDTLVPSPEYAETFDQNLARLVDLAEANSTEE